MSGMGSNPGAPTPSNPTGGGPFGGNNPFVNLSTLVTGVQDVVKAVYTLQQQLVDLIALGGATNTDLASIAASLVSINTTLGTTHTGSKTFDPPSIADKASTTTTVTVTGASLGDFAVASFSLDTTGVSLAAQVTSANTVTVIFSNLTGGAVDLASGLLRARTFS